MDECRAAFLRRLRLVGQPLLWDGGVGVALLERGLDLTKDTPEDWLFCHPEQVVAVHRGFAQARVQVLQTNTFGLLRNLLLNKRPVHPLTGRPQTVSEQVDRSVELLLASLPQNLGFGAQARPYLIGSVGPTGLSALQADAQSQTDSLHEAFFALAQAFAANPVDALILETCLDPLELGVALKAVRAAAPSLPLLVSVTLVPGCTGLQTPLGVPVKRMLAELGRNPPDAVGVNCSLDADQMIPAVCEMARFAGRSSGQLPVIARPQLHRATKTGFQNTVSPDQFSAGLLRLLSEGATSVGGCCGVTAAHLEAASRALAANAER